MPDLGVVLARLADDPAFAGTVHADPGSALSGYNLSPSDLETVDHALRSIRANDLTPAQAVGEPCLDAASGTAQGPSEPCLTPPDSTTAQGTADPCVTPPDSTAAQGVGEPCLTPPDSTAAQGVSDPCTTPADASAGHGPSDPCLSPDESTTAQGASDPCLIPPAEGGESHGGGEPCLTPPDSTAAQGVADPCISPAEGVESHGTSEPCVLPASGPTDPCIAPGPERAGRIGFRLLAGVGAVVVVGGLIALGLGVFGSDNTPQPTGLEVQANSVSPDAPPPPTDGSSTTARDPSVDPALAAAQPSTNATAAGSAKTVASTTTQASGVSTPGPGAGTTPTTAASTATTTGASNTTTPGGAATTTTAKPAPNPSVGAMTTGPPEIWETGTKGSCASQSKVTVKVTDPAGVESVTLYWTVGLDKGSIVMTPTTGDVYEAVLGAFKSRHGRHRWCEHPAHRHRN
jgi:hypothetical protein